MKKLFKSYFICWLILIVLFNVIVFVTPNIIGENNKKETVFWIGYGFVTLTFIIQALISHHIFKQDNKLDILFLRLPIFRVCYVTIIVGVIVGFILMVVPNIPWWVAIVACSIILAYLLIAFIYIFTGSRAIEDIEEKIKKQTFFIRSLTANAKILISVAKTEEMKKLANDIYDEIRYSDPMANERLEGMDKEVEKYYYKFEGAVNENCYEEASKYAEILIIKIKTRNENCKLFK